MLGDERVRVGAFRCGVPRVAGGFCEKELHVPEHPTFRAVARGYATELGPSLPQPLLPELLVNFTLGAELQRRRAQEALRRTRWLTLAAARSTDFIDYPQLVVFTREANCTLCTLAKAAATALDEPLLNVTVARCKPLIDEASTKASAAGKASTTGSSATPPEASFAFDEFPSPEQMTVANEQAQQMMQALRRQQADAEWYGDGDESGEEVASAEAAGLRSATARVRLAMLSAHHARRSLGLRLLDAVQAADDRNDIGELLLEAEALDATLAGEAHVHGAASPLRTVDWQDDGGGMRQGFTSLLLACRLGRRQAVELLLAKNATMVLPQPALIARNADLSQSAAALRANEALPWVISVEARHAEWPAAHSLLRAAFERSVHRAARHGETATVESLLQVCADGGTAADCLKVIDAHGGDGATLLLIASLRGDEELARVLLSMGASPNQPTAGGLTPLVAASLHCHVDVVKRLVDAGAVRASELQPGTERKRIQMRLGRAAPELWDAATLVRLHKTACLTDFDHTLLEGVLRDGTDDVTHASRRRTQGHSGTIRAPGEELIELAHRDFRPAAKPADDDDDDGDAPAPMESTGGGAAKVLSKMLTERPYLVAYRQRNTLQTPLLHAVQSRQAEPTQMLLSHGAHADSTNHVGITPLMLAAQTMSGDLVAMLLAAGANATRTVLHGPMQHRSAIDIAQRVRRQAHAVNPTVPTQWDQVVRTLQDATAAAMAREEQMVEADQEPIPEDDQPASEGEEDAGAASGEAGGADKEAEEATPDGEAIPEATEEVDEEYSVCAHEHIGWTPEVRLYGAGRGLGRGLSLLGRPFADESDLNSALDGAKAMAHMLRDVYDMQLAETEPPLDFEERDEEGTEEGSCATPMFEELDIPRLWRESDPAALLAGPAAVAPPSTPLALGTKPAGKANTPARIAPGAKDPKKLKRGPSTGGGGGVVGAISA